MATDTPTKTRAPEVPTGDDAPRSNQPEQPRETRSNEQEGSLGAANGAPAPDDSGLEAVEGYRLLTESAAEAGTLAAALSFPDIGEASYGPLPAELTRQVLETVHGPDDRVQITNTAAFPWRMHCSLRIKSRDGAFYSGTGWFVGPHTLMTAGHVVYIRNSGVPGRDGWVQSIEVMPGRNGASLPYGSVTSTSFRSVVGWTQNGDPNYDYGAIILPSDLGNTTGWFGFGAYDDATLLASTGNIAGYPADKPAGTQWYAARRIDSVGPRKVYYDIDTFGGQSGSCVYRIVNGQRYAMAVHAYGGATTNSGTRIVSGVYQNILNWKA